MIYITNKLTDKNYKKKSYINKLYTVYSTIL